MTYYNNTWVEDVTGGWGVDLLLLDPCSTQLGLIVGALDGGAGLMMVDPCSIPIGLKIGPLGGGVDLSLLNNAWVDYVTVGWWLLAYCVSTLVQRWG